MTVYFVEMGFCFQPVQNVFTLENNACISFDEASETMVMAPWTDGTFWRDFNGMLVGWIELDGSFFPPLGFIPPPDILPPEPPVPPIPPIPPIPPVPPPQLGTLAIGTRMAVALAAAPQPELTLVWSDEFATRSIAFPATNAVNWAHYFFGFNVRFLEGNSDDALKTLDEVGVPTVHSTLVETGLWGDHEFFLHEVIDGIMYLRTYPTPPLHQFTLFDGFPYIAGMLSGELSYGQRYGYWECRLKINSLTQGQHFTAWLLANNNAYPPEIDILECVGQFQTTILTNVFGELPEVPLFPGTEVLPSISSDWHVIGFDWTPTTCTWTMDGVVVRQIPNFVVLDDKQMYFLLTWEVAGNFEGNPDGTTVWPGEVAVDYVRIYARAESEGGVP